MEVVIIRSPLVYGPGNPGNFLSLLRIIAKGIPLPLSSVCNLKSFLYVENLASALVCCAIHPNAAGQTYNGLKKSMVMQSRKGAKRDKNTKAFLMS